MEEEIQKKKKMTKKAIIISSCICFLIIMLLVFSMIFAITHQNQDKIADGVFLGNIDISNLKKEEAISLLNKKTEEKKGKSITFRYQDYQTTIPIEQMGIEFHVEESIENAYQIGRNSNIFKNNFDVIQTKIQKKHLQMNISYQDEGWKQQLANINGAIPGAMKQSDYYIEGENLIITSGKEGIMVKEEELKKEITEKLADMNQENYEIDIPTEIKTPGEINIDKIYEQIHKEAKDAYYTNNPFQVYPHVDGVDFAISLDEIKNMLKEKKEEYIIPLKITKPKVTTDQIGSEAFPNRLATFSTKYNAGDTARTTNLRLASNKINGTVIMPGETFSYNKVVGERTIAAGYKEAKVYENGRVVDGLGGGICQISSTLYNAVIYANLEIVSRRNHQFVPSYVKAGRDATVVYGSQDFKFKNTRNYPIKIQSSVSGGIAKIDIFGKREEVEYDIEIKSTITGSIPTKTVYTDDPTMEAGKEVVKQKGHNGTKSETYKIVSLNGKVISKTLLSKDTYNAMQTLIVRGTKGATPEVPVETPPAQTPPEETTPPATDNTPPSSGNDENNSEEVPDDNTTQIP